MNWIVLKKSGREQQKNRKLESKDPLEYKNEAENEPYLFMARKAGKAKEQRLKDVG